MALTVAAYLCVLGTALSLPVPQQNPMGPPPNSPGNGNFFGDTFGQFGGVGTLGGQTQSQSQGSGFPAFGGFSNFNTQFQTQSQTQINANAVGVQTAKAESAQNLNIESNSQSQESDTTGAAQSGTKLLGQGVTNFETQLTDQNVVKKQTQAVLQRETVASGPGVAGGSRGKVAVQDAQSSSGNAVIKAGVASGNIGAETYLEGSVSPQGTNQKSGCRTVVQGTGFVYTCGQSAQSTGQHQVQAAEQTKLQRQPPVGGHGG